MNDQETVWNGEFGQTYTERCRKTVEEQDELWFRLFGVRRRELNRRFLHDVDRCARVLEVGMNLGAQLAALQTMGFRNLFGIEVQRYASRLAARETRGIRVIRASAFDLPFHDGSFDLVFTSSVLIHIHPDRVERVLSEIVRCSRRFIWGFEYFSEEYQEINYRGHDGLLWKADFVKLFQKVAPRLDLVRLERLPYLKDSNVDFMYLLEKR